MRELGAKLWELIEKIAHFFVFGFLRIFHKELTEEQWEAFMQFVKFGMVGLSNTALTYIVYALLVTLGLHYQLIWMADKPMESHRIHTAIGTLLERVAENLKRNHQA